MDNEGRPLNMDIYFDRVVMVCNRTSQMVITTGILLDEERILTSYNPYRKTIAENKFTDLAVAVLMGRQFNSTAFQYIHKIEYYSIECHEQVVATNDTSLTPEQWHGIGKQHSSVHDLLILRIDTKLELLDPDPQKYSFDSISYYYFTSTGPMITVLAKRKDWLGNAVKFASLGYKDAKHIANGNGSILSTYEYEEGSNVVTDCDEWIIRDWGRVICIKNDDNNLGIASGSLLVYNNKLFGIGSFTLNKGNVSIFVFTDVRKYRREIFNKCVRESAESSTDSTTDMSTDDEYSSTPKQFHLG
ncbi:unnamed protein product [Chilo suppressalis]|uniref:Peptidase S1 domain-containing protein n=1 Tax=Chilo suppressalis TaxID=168631 RepID=A0ABN8BA96_CHISP|nr:unnamed protein product [Chilo suppressalis]